MALSACDLENRPNLAAAQPRGASVAFDSIDGLPPAQFHTLVQDLNNEAQTRRLAVISRDSPSAYRVRGYLAADIVKGKTTVAWVWDVFDRHQQRALRISGSMPAAGQRHAGWPAVDAATLRQIAHNSMDQIAAFLTSPAVAPGAAPAQVALAAVPPASSPEAAGIFRIVHPDADPVANAKAAPRESQIAAAPAPASQASAVVQPATVAVPLPRRRPLPATAVSANPTTTLLAARALR